MTERLSKWHSANVKPELPGWYDVRYQNQSATEPYFRRRYFDGAAWRFNPQSGTCLFGNNKKNAPYEAWRGLAEDPNGCSSHNT